MGLCPPPRAKDAVRNKSCRLGAFYFDVFRKRSAYGSLVFDDTAARGREPRQATDGRRWTRMRALYGDSCNGAGNGTCLRSVATTRAALPGVTPGNALRATHPKTSGSLAEIERQAAPSPALGVSFDSSPGIRTQADRLATLQFTTRHLSPSCVRQQGWAAVLATADSARVARPAAVAGSRCAHRDCLTQDRDETARSAGVAPATKVRT